MTHHTYETKSVVAIAPAPGWFAEFARADDLPTHKPLACWAVVEDVVTNGEVVDRDEEVEPDYRLHFVVGLIAEPGFTILTPAGDSPDFERYVNRGGE